MKLTNPMISAVATVCTGLLLSQAASCNAVTSEDAVYRTPSSAQLHHGEQVFSWLFARRSYASARSGALDLGFSWQETDTDITLVDQENRGWGEYRFSKSTADGKALQAPHRFHDRYTGAIARQLFELQGFTSVALNSLSRRTPVDDSEVATADLARLPDSFHIAYSRAFAAQYPQGQLIQLHGFSREKRTSAEARQASIILSTGGPWSSAYLLAIQSCFNARDWPSLRYPQQVRELGATRNSVGALLRNLGHGGFTHIEMDLDTRKQLSGDQSRLASFARCLLEPAQ